MYESYPDHVGLLSGMIQLVDSARDLKKTPKSDDPSAATPSLDTIAPSDDPAAMNSLIPGRVNDYLYVRKIADGGMGEVWLAEQLRPLKRVVALKLIKSNLGDSQTILRFEVERQVLSMMDHEYIAKIFDAGTTTLGTPYFAMEFIDGISITQYCDRNRLTIVERLNLFVDVCEAIGHAHQQGIIHRDIKPSNILVMRQGDRHIPKIIDFGLAKAIERQTRLTDKSVFTEVGQVVGTLQYMSPEQAEMNPLLIDTRTDVFALGLILYEMLTGRPAMEQNRLHDVDIFDQLQRVKSAEFTVPSRRLDKIEHSSTKIAAQMKISSKRLRQLLQGDLDWIVMKAIEKEKTRRFTSVAALADDVRRFLQNEPVEARPPTNVYRIQKYVKKNRYAVLFVGTVLSLLIVGLCGTSAGMLRANAESRLAIKARNDEKTQRQIADVNASRARNAEKEAVTKRKNSEALSDFLVSCFRSPSPEVSGRSVTLYDTLASYMYSLRSNDSIPADQRGRLLYVISRSFLELGDLAESAKSIRYAIDLVKPEVDSRDAELLEFESFQGLVMLKSGQSKEAVELLEHIEKQMAVSMDESDGAFIKARDYLAQAYFGNQKYEKGITLWLHLISLIQASKTADLFLELGIRNNLANGYAQISEFEKAESLLNETLIQSQAIFGPDDPRVQTAKNNLAAVLVNRNRFAEAAALYIDVLDKRRELLGENHLETVGSQNGLARCYRAMGKPDEAIVLLKKSIDALSSKSLENHPDMRTNQSNLASAYLAKKDYQSAIDLLAPLIDGIREKEGWSSDTCKSMLLHLAESRLATGGGELIRPMLVDFLGYCEKEKLANRAVAIAHLRYGEILLESKQTSVAYEEFKAAWELVVRLRSAPSSVKPEHVNAILNRLDECSESLGLGNDRATWEQERELISSQDKK